MTKSSGTILDGECRPEVRGAGTEPRNVQGERSDPIVNTARSIQSRVSSVLAAGLMIALGLGALTWYYAHALSRQKQAREAAVAAAANNAQGEMPLPPLDSVGSPHMATPDPATPEAVGKSEAITGQGALGASTANAPGLAPNLPPESMHPYGYPGSDALRPPQRQPPVDRRLSGAAFARESTQSSVLTSTFGLGQEGSVTTPASGQPTTGQTSPVEDRLSTLLRPTVTPVSRAQVLPTQQFLLPKGAFIDCTLETAIDSTLPGMTTCVTATDTFGVDGKVVLLERGSKLVGETRGEVQGGSARVFVLWTEARTPTGVLVPLDSPGTDQLGRSGLPGEVNRHFWDRFGAAMLISVINGVMQAAVQSSTRGGGAIIYNPSASQDALTDILKGTINIAPTVIKHQGDRIQILVARDLDFRPVYELRVAGP